MDGLFGPMETTAKAGMNAFGGILSAPMNKMAEYSQKFGMRYGQVDIGTAEWLKKKGMMFNGVQPGLMADIGGVAGSAAALALLGKQFNSKKALKKIATAYLLNSAGDIAKQYLRPQNAGPA